MSGSDGAPESPTGAPTSTREQGTPVALHRTYDNPMAQQHRGEEEDDEKVHHGRDSPPPATTDFGDDDDTPAGTPDRVRRRQSTAPCAAPALPRPCTTRANASYQNAKCHQT